MENEEMKYKEEAAVVSTDEKALEICCNCGAVMEQGDDFCPKCGTPKKKLNVCGNCGAELKEGQGFCTKCGQKSDFGAGVNPSFDSVQSETVIDKANKRKKKTPVIIGAAVIIAIFLAVAGFKIIPYILTDSAGYLENGEYEKAWKKAKTEQEKQRVIEAYLADDEYDKAWEKAETEEWKQKVIDACLADKEYDKAWEKSEKEEQKQRVIDVCLSDGEYDKAWEKAETEEWKQKVIDACLADKEYDKAWEKSEREEQKQKVIDACLADKEYDKAWEKAETEEWKQEVIGAYLAIGDYENAYEKASNSEKKLEIRAENAAAFNSIFSIDNLKDPSSFLLRDAYYNENELEGIISKQLVLFISAANSFGGNVSSYWLYIWDDEAQEWDFFSALSDLEDEEYSIYDDEDDITEKYINNIYRISIRGTMSDGIRLSKDSVERINTLFKNNILDKVKLIKTDDIATPL